MHVFDRDGRLYRLRRQQDRRDAYTLAAVLVALLVGITFALNHLIP